MSNHMLIKTELIINYNHREIIKKIKLCNLQSKLIAVDKNCLLN